MPVRSYRWSKFYHFPRRVTFSFLSLDPNSKCFCAGDISSLKAAQTVPHETLLVSSGKFTSGLDFSGGAFFSSGRRFYLLRGALFRPWKKHSKIQRGLTLPEQKMRSKTVRRCRGKRSIDKRMKDTSFIVIETTVLLSTNLHNGNLIISQFEVFCIVCIISCHQYPLLPRFSMCCSSSCALAYDISDPSWHWNFYHIRRIFWFRGLNYAWWDSSLSWRLYHKLCTKTGCVAAVLPKQMFILLSGVAQISNKTIWAMTRMLSCNTGS